ncbi:MAG: radical SAM protein [Bacteroidetes bacterium]|nr:radical SAM protein [Bacteroidota bacterium]MBU1423465.1 radical SAM protein [Bacteroidota bacterium]MBU2472184.1 radical SAM protein [Bacteroidota bacterium]MBU2636421.1 radical SAM protein [Bacteroidota bacterium]
MIVFGPVPSRRLGRSLGINNIPPKICSYNCVYCQVGRTSSSYLSLERKTFYEPKAILNEVKIKIDEIKSKGEDFDYITFVPDGEPTLDSNLRDEILALKQFEYPVAVITNSSLLWDEKVQDDLMLADYVSVKVDTVVESKWKKINRPNKKFNFELMLNGVKEFSKKYKGVLTTETMVVKDINDNEEETIELGNYLKELNANTSYLMIPLRPPAEYWVKVPDEKVIVKIYNTLTKALPKVELLIFPESNDFISTGNIEDELLSITAVHPMREDSVKEFLKQKNKDWDIILSLITKKKIREIDYLNQKFYARRFIN